MRELIPIRTPSNSWRGFALRVAIIAIAALVVLGIASLFGWSFDAPRQPTFPAKTYLSTKR